MELACFEGPAMSSPQQTNSYGGGDPWAGASLTHSTDIHAREGPHTEAYGGGTCASCKGTSLSLSDAEGIRMRGGGGSSSSPEDEPLLEQTDEGRRSGGDSHGSKLDDVLGDCVQGDLGGGGHRNGLAAATNKGTQGLKRQCAW
jgi:hypothetical protein